MNYWIFYQRFFGLLRPQETKLNYLGFTHRLVKRVVANSLEQVYLQMQAEQWSPHGEARTLIRGLHLSHTSLSVGDVVQDGRGACWVCDLTGWLPLRSEPRSGTARPPLWMATEADLQSGQVTRLKISNERDCLPADAYTVESIGGLTFVDLLTLARLIEQRLGLSVCIDLGDEFYETAAAEGDDYQFYVGYTLDGGYSQAIVSVLANSPAMARGRIEEELKKPGRVHYLARWRQSGRLVKPRLEQPEANQSISQARKDKKNAIPLD